MRRVHLDEVWTPQELELRFGITRMDLRQKYMYALTAEQYLETEGLWKFHWPSSSALFTTELLQKWYPHIDFPDPPGFLMQPLGSIYSLAEAAEEWMLPEQQLYRTLELLAEESFTYYTKAGKLRRISVNGSTTWLLTKDCMNQLFGMPKSRSKTVQGKDS